MALCSWSTMSVSLARWRDSENAACPVQDAWLLSAHRRRSSNATTLDEIIEELAASSTSERVSRMIDHDEKASMERKKREGYF